MSKKYFIDGRLGYIKPGGNSYPREREVERQKLAEEQGIQTMIMKYRERANSVVKRLSGLV